MGLGRRGNSASRLSAHRIARGKPVRNAFIESFNGRLRNKLLSEEIFETPAAARRRSGSGGATISTPTARALGGLTPAARRALELDEGSGPSTLGNGVSIRSTLQWIEGPEGLGSSSQ